MQTQPRITLASTPHALSPSTWELALDAVDRGLLDQLAFLSRSYQRRNHTKAAYCWPSRRWLGSRVARSVRSVSRHTRKLRAWGLIRFTQRRQENDRWQTNLYSLTGKVAWIAAKALRRWLHRSTASDEPRHPRQDTAPQPHPAGARAP